MQENIYKSFLNNRKISDEVISDFNLRVGENPTIGECLVIPVTDSEGNFLFNKYRRNPSSDDKPKYLYDKGGRVCLYGLNQAIKAGAKTILITEGELDTLVGWSHNLPSVSSTGGAMSFQEEWQEFFKDKETIICFDNDAPGGEGMAKTLDLIPHAKLLFLPDRPGIKDISDYVTSGGDLNALIKTAVRLNSLEQIIEHRAERLSTWHSTYFHDAYIKTHTKPVFIKSTRERDPDVKDKIARAKTFPISDLISFDKSGMTNCLWHKEKHGSLKLYRETNTVYCFGQCGKVHDVIDVYMKLNNCSFIDAVKKLQ
jgi:DNA primase